MDRTRGPREMLLFLAASAAGIYGLGKGLEGLFTAAGGLNVAWLAVTGVAFIVLCSQMGRVHDRWPRRTSGRLRRHVNRFNRGRPTEAERRQAAPRQ